DVDGDAETLNVGDGVEDVREQIEVVHGSTQRVPGGLGRQVLNSESIAKADPGMSRRVMLHHARRVWGVRADGLVEGSFRGLRRQAGGSVQHVQSRGGRVVQ